MAVRETVALIGIAGLGGVWSVAWGLRRLDRPARTAMLDARTGFQVRLDALRARTAVLTRRQDLPPPARALVDEVVMELVMMDSTLARAASAREVDGLVPQVERCLGLLERAGAAAGVVLPAADPFAGLCRTDPAHGVAAADGLCAPCRADAAAGAPRPVRLVSVAGRPVPFDAAPPRRPPAQPAGAADGGMIAPS